MIHRCRVCGITAGGLVRDRYGPDEVQWPEPDLCGGCAAGKVNMTDTSGLKKNDLTTEEYREYDFGGRVYRITKPEKLFMRPGGTTHRVLDADGVIHCVPAPGVCGCVLRWKSTDPKNPCDF